MPCMKCANGKWKYGEGGNCQFDTLAACKRAAAAIHIGDKDMTPVAPQVVGPKPQSPLHDPLCPCTSCKACKQ